MLFPPKDVYVSLNGIVIPKHGYVVMTDIGSTSDTALVCHTNRSPRYPNTVSGGDWFMPEGERVKNGLTFVQGFWRNRGPMVVRLLRNIDDNSTTNGIYKCRMLDDDSISHSYHVGLYNEGEGSGYRHYHEFTSTFAGDIQINSPLSVETGGLSQFTITCISAGGPATTITWTRDSTTVTEGTETVLDDPLTAQYTHTLTATGTGEYSCTVANSAFSTSATITLRGPIPPKVYNETVSVFFLFRSSTSQ